MKSPRVLISASAGSGKTYRLVHHFLAILHDSLQTAEGSSPPLPLRGKKTIRPDAASASVVERILAATFTRTAAAEIVDRILKRLAEATLDSKERAALGKELGAARLTEQDCGKLLQAFVGGLHRLRVCTLDSFLIRSSHAFSTELGLPDNWTILDDAADRAVALEAIDQLLTEHAADPQRSEMMLALLIMLNQGQYKLQIRQRLLDHLRDTQPALIAGPAQAWEVIGPQEEHLLSGDVFGGLARSFAADAEPLVPRTKAGAPDKRWSSAIDNIAANARLNDWDHLLQARFICACSEAEPAFSGRPIPPRMIDLLRPIKDCAAANVLQALRRRNLSTRVLLDEFVREYHQAKLRRCGFRFDDFTRMLHDARVTDNLPDFYFRLDGKIDHILLDEFQDTSIPQWKLIEPLAAEIMAGGEGAAGAQRTFFCVGDIKQTLYGWRDAEPELLKNLTTRWPELQQEHLLISRRSVPVIIKTVNQIFGGIGRNPVLTHTEPDKAFLTEAAETWAEWFKEHDTVHKNAPGFCRLLTCEEGEHKADMQLSAIKLAAERVSELHKANPNADIGVLVRRKRFVAPLLARLRKMGISASGEGGGSLADDVAVLTVLSLLHLIDHPSDSAAAYHVATSPLGAAVEITAFDLNDAATRNAILRQTTSLRMEILDMGLGAAINQWLGRCAASCDARNFRRLQRLVSLAHSYDYDGGDLRPFIDSVRGSKVEESESARVRIMTIHVSKGRQFDYVILPDLDGPFMGIGPPVLISRPGLLREADCITVRPSATQASVHERLGEMMSHSKRRQIVEELCVLYVALTRAVSGLEMIVHPTAKPACSPAGVLRGALTDGAAPPQSQIWAHKDNVMPQASSETERTIELPTPIFVRVAPPEGVSRLRPQLTPSALEGSGYIDLHRMLTFEQQYGLNWGSVMHRWFEMIDWLDEPLPNDAALRAAADELDLSISPRQLEEMVESFHKACTSSNIATLLRRSNYLSTAPGATLELWRERIFTVPLSSPELPSGAIVKGQIDRVVITRSAKKTTAEVVDYKTDVVDAKSAAEKTAHYAPQIRAYRTAVARMLRIDESLVTAKLAFVGSDVLTTV